MPELKTFENGVIEGFHAFSGQFRVNDDLCKDSIKITSRKLSKSPSFFV